MDFFILAVCRCSRRTAQEEAQYGSYCQDCWEIIKQYNNCVSCGIDVKKTRLYVDLKYKMPTCRKCYPYEPKLMEANSEIF